MKQSSLMSRLVRFGGYLSWTLLDQAVMLGAARLVLFPLLLRVFIRALNEEAGTDLFGSFVLAMGFLNVIGTSPSNGLSGYVLREAVHYKDAQQRLMLRTVSVLSIIVGLPFALVYLFGGALIGKAYGDSTLATLLPFLGIYLLFLNVVQTALTIYRVRRAFGWIVIVHGVGVALLFACVPLYFAFGVVGLGYAYVLSGAAALVTVLLLERDTYLARPFYSADFRAAALKVWLPLSLSAFIYLSASYLDRLILGYWWPSADVAVFFAAAATTQLFTLPAGQASALTLSLLGGIRNRDRFSRVFYASYLGGACLLAVVIFAVGTVLGEFILDTLYPSVSEQALPLWNYGVAASAATTITLGCRPFVVKFLSPGILPVLATVTLLARVLPLIMLVPTGGRLGAIQALLIGSVATALAWGTVYFTSLVLHRPPIRRVTTEGDANEDDRGADELVA